MLKDKSCAYYTTSALPCELCYSLSMNGNVDMTAKAVEPKSFGKCLGRLIGGSIVLRVAVFVTLATMFILGIVTIPVGIAALSAILFGFADYRASREFMSKAERVVMGIVIVWVTISLLALVAAVIMLTTNNLCLLSCSDTQFALRGAVFFVLLFL